MYKKREIAEMIFRPCNITESMLERLISRCMTWENHKLINEFKKSTKINIEYTGGGMFKLNY